MYFLYIVLRILIKCSYFTQEFVIVYAQMQQIVADTEYAISKYRVRVILLFKSLLKSSENNEIKPAQVCHISYYNSHTY